MSGIHHQELQKFVKMHHSKYPTLINFSYLLGDLSANAIFMFECERECCKITNNLSRWFYVRDTKLMFTDENSRDTLYFYILHKQLQDAL